MFFNVNSICKLVFKVFNSFNNYLCYRFKDTGYYIVIWLIDHRQLDQLSFSKLCLDLVIELCASPKLIIKRFFYSAVPNLCTSNGFDICFC